MAIFNGDNGNNSITGTASNDTIRPYLGLDTVDGAGGTDLLIVNYSTLGRNITLSGNTYSDGIANRVTYYSIERFNITTGIGSDYLRGGALADTLSGGGGNDTLRGSGGLDSINGGLGNDTWAEDYSGLTKAVSISLTDVLINGDATAAVTIGGVAGPAVLNIEALSVQTGSKNDFVSSGPFALNDDIRTGVGNDTINVGTGGRDYVHGGDGIDLGIFDWSASTTDITVDPYYDDYVDDENRYVNFDAIERFNLTGGAGNDHLAGDVYNDTLIGGAGNDTLESGNGSDSVDGGTGVDLWTANYGSATNAINVQLSATLDTNAIKGGIAGASTTNVERLTFTSGSGNDTVSTAPFAYSDSIWTNGGDDTINVGKGGRDYVHGGDGVDLGIFNWSASTTAITVDPYYDDYADGEGRYVNFDAVERFNLTGGSGNDYLAGDAWDDTLVGNGGADTLNSGTYSAATGASNVDTINGGVGVDLWVADYSGQAAGIVVALNKTGDNAVLSGIADSTSTATVTNIERLTLYTGIGADNISTAPYAYNDDIRTNAGDDTVNVGIGGRDYVHGGDGIDLGIFNWSASTTDITVDPYYDDYADGENRLVNFDAVERFSLTGGSGNDHLAGDIYNDTLTGGAGNDTLEGGRGSDSIDGGTGIDLWRADYGTANLNINVQLSATQDVNAIKGGIAGGVAKNVERLYLTAGVGNDTLSSAPFALDDSVWANAGDDTINVGQGGSDYVHGGDGVDLGIFDWSASTTAITVDPYYDDYADGEGRYVNFDAVERFNLTGGSGNDYLCGDSYNDTLIGGAGRDTLNSVGGVDSVDGELGVDRWQANFSGETEDININLGFTASNAIRGGIGGTAKNVEALTFTSGSGNDTISSGQFSYNDNIWTNDGDDTINVGRGGRDYVHGGNGVDLGIFDWSASTTSIAVDPYWDDYADGEGRYVNFDAVEQFNLKGGSGNDYLAGDGYSDTLSGGDGYDTLDGFGGDDTLIGGTGGDTFIFRNGCGQDVIQDFQAGAGVEDVIYFYYSPFATMDFATIQSHMQQVGGDVVLTLSDTDSITFLGITMGSFVTDDFLS